jgi:hypothetical protein
VPGVKSCIDRVTCIEPTTGMSGCPDTEASPPAAP